MPSFFLCESILKRVSALRTINSYNSLRRGRSLVYLAKDNVTEIYGFFLMTSILFSDVFTTAALYKLHWRKGENMDALCARCAIYSEYPVISDIVNVQILFARTRTKSVSVYERPNFHELFINEAETQEKHLNVGCNCFTPENICLNRCQQIFAASSSLL